ncbi:MAG: DNA polymerase III subunit beta [bacterium]|nr:DNA polymerase III subunit beta [bacterium]MDE0438505.1 DNA polymerase III subunit beta [bacterium]
MHIRADRDDLAEAFGRANRAVGVKTALPILRGVLCQASGSKLRVTGSDTEVTVRTAVEVEVVEDGSFVVPGRLMTDAVRRMPEGAITIRSDDGEVELSGNGPQFTIRQLALEDYPDLAEPDLGGAVEVDGKSLVAAVAQVTVAASNDSARPILTGVLIEDGDRGLRLVATDSYRLAVRDLADTEVGGSGLVPARGLRELGRTVAADVISVAIHDREVIFASERGSLSIRLIEGSFPNYRQLLPQKYPNEVVLRKDQLLDAVGRASLVAEDHIPIRLKLTEGGVHIAVSRRDVGGESELIPGEYRGDAAEVDIAFNSRYLSDGVSALEGDEVRVEVVDSFKPSVIRSEGHEDFLYLLMPVRV